MLQHSITEANCTRNYHHHYRFGEAVVCLLQLAKTSTATRSFGLNNDSESSATSCCFPASVRLTILFFLFLCCTDSFSHLCFRFYTSFGTRSFLFSLQFCFVTHSTGDAYMFSRCLTVKDCRVVSSTLLALAGETCHHQSRKLRTLVYLWYGVKLVVCSLETCLIQPKTATTTTLILIDNAHARSVLLRFGRCTCALGVIRWKHQHHQQQQSKYCDKS